MKLGSGAVGGHPTEPQCSDKEAEEPTYDERDVNTHEHLHEQEYVADEEDHDRYIPEVFIAEAVSLAGLEASVPSH